MKVYKKEGDMYWLDDSDFVCAKYLMGGLFAIRYCGTANKWIVPKSNSQRHSDITNAVQVFYKNKGTHLECAALDSITITETAC